jgi:NAD(P)-dependent dehydrogenase (short-subunit alcohol dehydrogenase family)
MNRIFKFLFLLAASFGFSEQKVVLISGASGGIGFAAAQAFAEQGWKVWAGHRDSIPRALDGARWVYLDVADESSIQKAMAELIEEEGRLDVLVNNAAFGIIGVEEEIGIEQAKKLFDVNFFGCLRLIQAASPIMRKQNSGHIINISSTSGIRAIPGYGLYGATKFALEGLSESLAATLSPWNIQVSIVEPGSVHNSFLFNCQYGEKDSGEPIYGRFIKALIARQEQFTEQGQPNEEIGALIVNIAENPKPDMRYQTSGKVKETAAKKFVDLTGNALRDEQIRLFKDLTSHDR